MKFRLLFVCFTIGIFCHQIAASRLLYKDYYQFYCDLMEVSLDDYETDLDDTEFMEFHKKMKTKAIEQV